MSEGNGNGRESRCGDSLASLEAQTPEGAGSAVCPDTGELLQSVDTDGHIVDCRVVGTPRKHFRTLFLEAMAREGRRRGQSLVDFCVERAYDDPRMAMVFVKALIEPQKAEATVPLALEDSRGRGEQLPAADVKTMTMKAREHLRIVLQEVRRSTPAAAEIPEADRRLGELPALGMPGDAGHVAPPQRMDAEVEAIPKEPIKTYPKSSDKRRLARLERRAANRKAWRERHLSMEAQKEANRAAGKAKKKAGLVDTDEPPIPKLRAVPPTKPRREDEPE